VTEAKEISTGRLYKVIFQEVSYVSSYDKTKRVVIYVDQQDQTRVLVRDQNEFDRMFEVK